MGLSSSLFFRPEAFTGGGGAADTGRCADGEPVSCDPIEMKFLMKIQTLLETTFLGLERVADAADGGASIWLIGDC